jgi:hypothetical protein
MVWLAPVCREEKTTVPELVAAAYAVPAWSELIESTKSWIDSPALMVYELPLTVMASSLAGLVKP